nr:immunoglobulin light chain junction region [Macaca mulatta]
CQHGFGIPVTV